MGLCFKDVCPAHLCHAYRGVRCYCWHVQHVWPRKQYPVKACPNDSLSGTLEVEDQCGWCAESFSQPGLGGREGEVKELGVWGGNPSVLWNAYLDRWLMVNAMSHLMKLKRKRL